MHSDTSSEGRELVTVILAAFQLSLNGFVKLSGIDYDGYESEVRVFFRVFVCFVVLVF